MRKFIISLLAGAFAFSSANAASDSIAVVQDSTTMIMPICEVGDSLEAGVETPVLSWNDNIACYLAAQPDYMYIPLVFEQYTAIDSTCNENEVDSIALKINDTWLKTSIQKRKQTEEMRFLAMIRDPQSVQFNASELPEPPKSYIIKTDPSKRGVTVEERAVENIAQVETEAVKVKKWIHTVNGSVQVSQAYLSENWYQGGENNVNAIGTFLWNVKLNENVYKNLLFENSIEYKVGLNSATQDTLRAYTINQDLFQINTKFGYKAIKNWYYSTNMRFKTQLLNNYTPNTYKMKASFLSPAELNLGVGMTYNKTSKNEKVGFNMSISPLSIDMNMCREIEKLSPTSFGIDEGKHFKAKYGSNVEAKLNWKLCHEVTWTSRLFAFTNYSGIQGDWENTFNFTINKYLSTKLYLHLRYDDAVKPHPDWRYWQFNEILSFGFNYTFSMK